MSRCRPDCAARTSSRSRRRSTASRSTPLEMTAKLSEHRAGRLARRADDRSAPNGNATGNVDSALRGYVEPRDPGPAHRRRPGRRHRRARDPLIRRRAGFDGLWPELSGATLKSVSTVPTRYWHPLPDGRVQCDVCPRACKLRDGQRGLCFVRAREGDGDRPHHVRAIERLLRRPDREEAAEPLPARLGGAVVRHRRLQPRVPVLPELGHLQVEGDRHARGRRVARRSRRTAAAPRLPQHRVHVQRPDDLHGVRDRRRRRVSRRRVSRASRSPPDTSARSRGRTSTPTSTPPTSTSRRSPRTSTTTSAARTSTTCSTRSSTSCTKPTCGSRSRTC